LGVGGFKLENSTSGNEELTISTVNNTKFSVPVDGALLMPGAVCVVRDMSA
jgi:hypothetical protein